jgi:hypothetical protein
MAHEQPCRLLRIDLETMVARYKRRQLGMVG